MAFDTTYTLIFDSSFDELVLITIPGGKDTNICITQKELPELLIRHPEISDSLFKYQESYHKPEPEKDNNGNFVQFLEIIFLLLIIILINNIASNLTAWKNAFKKDLAPKIFLLAILSFFGITATFSSFSEFGWILLIFNAFIVFEFKNKRFFFAEVENNVTESSLTENNTAAVKKPLLKYDGSKLNFTDSEIDSALTKRFPYYVAISDANKERFIHRVKNFIQQKVFYIHDESGFKEMPILISASAIQLTFGLKKYLLPYFKNIHVFPEEFFRSNDLGVCFLEGNVSGNNINISWKHFLSGYQNRTDGQNVGLHELAHALYYQALIVLSGVDDDFHVSYNDFENHSNKVFDMEINPVGGLYSDYANKNFQEFWAESAEVFFERPQELKELYPDLYKILKELFKQDPLDLQNLPLS